jgi:hypothetical protein
VHLKTVSVCLFLFVLQEEWPLAQEMESGQLVLDRVRHHHLLDLVSLLTRPEGYFQQSLLYGDKDAFRYAWLFMQVGIFFVDLNAGGAFTLPPARGGLPDNITDD